MAGTMTAPKRRKSAKTGSRGSRDPKLRSKTRSGRHGDSPTSASGRTAGISADAVLNRTGKTWPQWVKALDGAGCRSLPHKEIAVIVHEKFGVSDWWSQMVTVGYERATGRREKHQTLRGYQGSASKTVNAPVSALYGAWEDARLRRKWLGRDAAFTVRKATKNKSMRITWGDGEGTIEVNFYAKGLARSQVAVQHNKLPDARAVVRTKAGWGRHLEALKGLLEP